MNAFEIGSIPSQRRGAPQFLAFESAFQSTARHQSQQRLAPLIAQWEVLVGLFKHGFEIPRLIERPELNNEDQHRTILIGLLGMGEAIWFQVKSVDDNALSSTGYERGFVKANLEYLRGKYQDWYALKDDEQAKLDYEKIMGELPHST